MRLTPAIHDALRRRCPRFMWASSMHALGTLPPTSIVFLAIPTLYMKDDDLRLCARLVSRARYAFCSHVPLPRPPFPPPTYSPAFAGRCAQGDCQDRAGRLCTHSSRCANLDLLYSHPDFFSKRSHPTKQRPRRDVCDDDDHDTKMCKPHLLPVAGESTGRLREWGTRHAARVRALEPGYLHGAQLVLHPTSAPSTRMPHIRTRPRIHGRGACAASGESHHARLPRARAPRRHDGSGALLFAGEPQQEGARACGIDHACSNLKRESA
ncbi:hypothetical protein DFH09DRAFT_1209644 [Mycena vulgaris]|nr:hypothetical protein DFH09DRAFT_1209644 [Mycena vulgaris]